MNVGEKLGPYEILEPIGKGGMGEVWKARDTRLDRIVAIKTSKSQFSERFEREARAVAALNHPNICTLHDVGPNYLVMEFVEGAPLKGPLPLDEALRLAHQLTDALEAAHEKHITHRDLKPGNIMLKPDGSIKVLDFGLAKIAAPVRTDVPIDESPTLTMGMTEVGMILGTAAYMAPEQAKGKDVDKRADIWAFGVVLYELVTGSRPFHGADMPEILASVINQQPSLEPVPLELRRLLKKGLEKDPAKRLRDIGDVWELLESAPVPVAAEPAPAPPAKKPVWPWAVAALAIATASALAWTHFTERPPERRSVRFQVPAPDKATIASFRLSPDGRYLAFIGVESGRARVWVRPIDSLEAQPLPGTDGAYPTGGDRLSWSPDSADILFTAQGKLKKVSVTGGPPQALAEAPGGARASWGSGGVILISPGAGIPIQRIPTAGGVPVPVTKLDGAEAHLYPEFLPDGRHFLYVVVGGKPEANGIYAASIETGETPVRLLPDTVPGYYAPGTKPGQSGHLLFRRENTLIAQPFDPEKRMFTGELFPVADPVNLSSVSANGALAFGAGGGSDRREMVWMDRTGKQMASAGPPAEYQMVRLSPDEKSLVFHRTEGGNDDVWVLDTARGVPTRLTFDPGGDNLPIWSPDGLRGLWSSNRGGGYDLYVRPASGAGKDELLIKMGTPNGWATDWSRDGKFILFQKPNSKGIRDLWIAPQKATGEANGAPFAYLESPFDKQNAVFSPDGHWIAYVSNDSGRDEVYVQPFPLTSEKKQISTGGGIDPAWRKDGSELFYLAADRNLMAVPVRTTATTVVPEAAKPLFQVPGNQVRRNFAVSADGRRFLVGKPVGDGTASPPITVVLDWRAGLKK